jgi:UDP-glucose:(heptosyl)LPS alpha-1,3-glucosyltransferase
VNLAVICRPFSFHGGTETATAGLMGEFVRRGHAVDLISTREQPDFPGARVRRLPVVPQPSVVRLLSFAWLARRATVGAGYDVVQGHERGFWQDVYRAGEGSHRAYIRARGRRLDRVNPHDAVLYWLERRIFSLRAARHIVAISRQGKAEIEALFGTPSARVSVVYNGVDLQRFHPNHRRRLGPPMRRSLGVPADSWVILFVGSGFERKGLGPLIEAVAQLRDPGCRLVVAGKGNAPHYQEIARRLGLSARVSWLGPRRDVEHLFSAADVVALPALYEPFGNVHLEALACGVPVLASARSGGSEVVTSGRNGWVVPEPVPAKIAEGLVTLRDSDQAELSEAARLSAEPFTYSAQADGFESVYRALKP